MGLLENHRIFWRFRGIFGDFGEYFPGFLSICYKKLETWKSFVTSDPEAFVCTLLTPPRSIRQRFYP